MIKHYPLVFAPLFRQALATVSQNPREYGKIATLVNEMMQNPLFSYRALPEAVKFHKSRKAYRWALGGNRSSKSQSIAQEVAWYATGTHPFKTIKVPNIGWYSTVTWEMVGSILWEKLETILSKTQYRVLWRNRGKGIPDTVFVQTPKGESKIIFKAYEQGADIFQGTDRRYIANDEQFPESIFLEQISRIGSGEGLDFFCAMTPIKPQPWLEEKLTVSKPAAWDIFEYSLDDNRESRGGFIPDHLIDALIAEWPEEVQPTRRNGKWASFLGAVYKTFNREKHVIKLADEKKFFPSGKPTDCVVIGGIDWGAVNPFVCLFACKIPHMDNAWYIFNEYYWDNRQKGQRLIRQHAQEIIRLTQQFGCRLQRVWADHDAQDRFEMDACGVSSQPAFKDVTLGIEHVQTLLKVHAAGPHLYFSERCRNTIREMITLRWPDGSDNRNPTENPVKKDDHACLHGDTEVNIKNRGWISMRNAPMFGQVWTPLGWKKYRRIDMGVKPVVEVGFSDGFSVVGTEDHYLLSKNLKWDTLRYLKEVSYESEGNIIHQAGISRADVLEMRPIFSTIREAAAHSLLDPSPRANSEGDDDSPLERDQDRQSNFQSSTADKGETFQPSHDGGEEAAGRKKCGSICRSSGESVALHQGREGISQNPSEEKLAEPSAENSAMRSLREDLYDERSTEDNSLLPLKLQNEGSVSASKGGGVVVRYRQMGSAQVYDLMVEDAHCFTLKNGIISHNCDAVRYVLYSEKILGGAGAGIDLTGKGFSRRW